MPFRIFISHDVDSDGHIADLLSTTLSNLSRGEVECQICSKQPGGVEWRRWIENEVSRCNLFLYIYTTDRRRQDWLLFEAGVFLGARRILNEAAVAAAANGDSEPEASGEAGALVSDHAPASRAGDPRTSEPAEAEQAGPDLVLSRTIRTDLVCIKSAGIPTPPAPIDYLQAYEADGVNLRRFLEDLLVKGEFNNDVPINRDLYTQFDAPAAGGGRSQLSKVITEIEEAFARSSIKSRFYRRRMVIGPFSSKAFDELEDDAEPAFPADTPVHVTDRAQDMIALPEVDENATHSWQHVDALDWPETGSWVDDLKRVAACVMRGNAYEPILTPFSSRNGRHCYPIVSRVDTIQNRVYRMSVIFVEHERDERPDELATSLGRAPPSFQTMIGMVNLARRVRWNVVEPFENHMRGPAAGRASASDLAVEFNSAFCRLEDEAREAGWLNPDTVKEAFPSLMHGEIDALFTRYREWRAKLEAAVDNPEEETLEPLSQELKRINKWFWLLALDRYDDLVSALGPHDLRSSWSEQRAASEADTWSSVLDKWHGRARDIEIPGLLSFDPPREFWVETALGRRGREIGGTLTIESASAEEPDERETATANVTGMFSVDRYFAFQYRVHDEKFPRFGIMLLKLAEHDRRIVRGLFLSKKLFEDDKMGFGQVVLVRSDSGLEPLFDKEPDWPARPRSRAGSGARRAATPKKKAAKKTTSGKKATKKKASRKKQAARRD